MDFCKERYFKYPACDNKLQANDCVVAMHAAVNELQEEYCARECFQEISPDFVFKFVAKSKESYLIMWQIFTDNKSVLTNPDFERLFPGGVTAYLQGVPAYLFTLAKVIDDETGSVVHQSILHQKSLQAKFSVYSATEVKCEELRTGHSYTVRLYYFIPSLDGVTIQIEVSETDFVVVKVRE